MKDRPDTPFSRDEATKARKIEALRQRFQAATPATRRPPLFRQWDWGRTLKALALLLLVLWAVLAGHF